MITEQQKIDIEARATDKLDKARMMIVTRSSFSFWGDTLKREYILDWSIQTGATNGTVVKFNPAFVDSLTIGQLIFLLAHEVLHIKLGHHLRRDQRDPLQWNYATDYAINDILRKEIHKTRNDQVPMEWIEGALFEQKFAGHAEEKIYDTLTSEQPEPDQNNDENGDQDNAGGDQNDDQAGGQGDDQDDQNDEQAGDQPGGGTPDIMGVETPEGFDDLDDDQKEQIRQDHEQQVRKDNAAAHAAGTLPASIKELFDISAAPIKNWKAILADFCLSRTRSEYDWNRYNRTYANYRIYLPDLGGVRIESAAIAIDVSGSVNREQLTRFLVETNDILTNCEVEETTVMQVNTRVTRVDEYQEGDEINPDVVSGGGTSFVPPFEYCDEQDIEPDFMIYFTDGYCYSFADEPEYPVLWVLFEDNPTFDPPYGDVATMDEA